MCVSSERYFLYSYVGRMLTGNIKIKGLLVIKDGTDSGDDIVDIPLYPVCRYHCFYVF